MKRLAPCLAAALFALLFAAAIAPAQKKGESQLRTVHGTVVAKDDSPVPTSIVYLKNLRTQVVQTHIADDSGHYRFSGLDPNVDYEIHAEKDDLSSNTHRISSLDGRKEMDITLRVDKKKSEK